MSTYDLQRAVIALLADLGSAEPATLVRRIEDSTHATRHQVREALRGLVDEELVAVTWGGELRSRVTSLETP